ncbi:MAG: class I SAM-dependent methyltransferase [Thermoplasmata archaeon]|nr:class I SAM-dependent methyltransferase [Thermoplasmata archaeon]
MDHRDHLALIRDGVAGAGPRWLELGAGDGEFTLALADVLGVTGDILALDRDRSALAQLSGRLAARFPRTRVRTAIADFTAGLDGGPFDGVLAANSLHFVAELLPVLAAIRTALRPGGRLVIVEYDAARGNPYVPHPMGLLAGRSSRRGPGSRRRACSSGSRAGSWGRSTPPSASGRPILAWYTPALTATTERSRSGSAPERARDGESRVGSPVTKVAREPCGRRPIARHEVTGSGPR